MHPIIAKRLVSILSTSQCPYLSLHALVSVCVSPQSESEQGEWAEALYDYTAEADDDLPLRQGDRILITAHIDEEWCSGRANGREGVFPRTFVQFS